MWWTKESVHEFDKSALKKTQIAYTLKNMIMRQGDI